MSQYVFVPPTTGRKRQRTATGKKTRAVSKSRAPRPRNNAISAPLVRVKNLRPKRILTKLHYSDISHSLTCVANGSPSVEWLYRGNSVFDPYQAAGGLQPRYLTQIEAMYQFYRVHGSKIVVSAVVSDGIKMPCEIYIVPRQSATALPSGGSEAVKEMDTCRTLGVNGDATIKSRSNYATTAGVYGVAKSEIADQLYEAGVGGNPTREWYWSITGARFDSGGTNQVAYFKVDIYYDVEFWGYKTIQQS